MHAPLIKGSRKKRKLMNKLWITKKLCLKRKLMNKIVFKPGMSNWRLFTLINLNKSRFRSQLTNAHFNSLLKVATAQTLVPDMNLLTVAKRFSTLHATNKQ